MSDETGTVSLPIALPTAPTAGETLKVITVNPDLPVTDTNFTTVQAAINAATARSVIQLMPRVYEETITITKEITLVGAGYPGEELFTGVGSVTTGAVNNTIFSGGGAAPSKQIIIAARCTFYNIGFSNGAPSAASQITTSDAWIAANTEQTVVNFVNCHIQASNPFAQLLLNIDHSATDEVRPSRTFRFTNCLINGSSPSSAMVVIGGRNKMQFINCRGSGLLSITSQEIDALIMENCKWRGLINSTGAAAPIAARKQVTIINCDLYHPDDVVGEFADSLIVLGNNFHLYLYKSRLTQNGSSAGGGSIRMNFNGDATSPGNLYTDLITTVSNVGDSRLYWLSGGARVVSHVALEEAI